MSGDQIISIIMLIASSALYNSIPKDAPDTCTQYFYPKNNITGIVFGTLGTLGFGYLYSKMYFLNK